MRFGLCCGLEEASKALDAGFDYVELAAAGFSGLEADWDREAYAGLTIEATNVFFPGAIKLFGPDSTDYLEYARRTVSRAAELGVTLMVIGSGASRKAPEGTDGEGRFAKVAQAIDEVAKPYGIRVAPESLNRSETNVGNDLRRLALNLQEVGVGYTADSYHVLFEWDADGQEVPLERLWVEQLPHLPLHVHMATLEGRMPPQHEDPLLQGFVARLHDLGYDGRVSLECSRPAETNLRQMITEAKALFGV